MTITLYKSKLPADFESQLEAHRQELLKHRFMIDVPAPIAPSFIEDCIRRVQYPIEAKKPDDFITDYKIIDDTPLPPTLREQKDKLIGKVMLTEQEASIKILPPGKTRLHALRRMDIMNKEQRTAAEEQFLLEAQERQERLDKLHRVVAHSLAEIEDLTEDNIDHWVLPNLS